MTVSSFPDSTPQLFIALCTAIKNWGVESGNEANLTAFEGLILYGLVNRLTNDYSKLKQSSSIKLGVG